MVLQDFIMDRSSAHLDGLISSHWTSRSILTLEIRAENEKKSKINLVFVTEKQRSSRALSALSHELTPCKGERLFFQRQPAANTSTSLQRRSGSVWDSARISKGQKHRGPGEMRQQLGSCLARARCSPSLPKGAEPERAFQRHWCYSTTAPPSPWVRPDGLRDLPLCLK